MEHLKPAGNGGRPRRELLRGSDSHAACEKPPRAPSLPLSSLSRLPLSSSPPTMQRSLTVNAYGPIIISG